MRKRSHGLIFTEQKFQKLQLRIKVCENREKSGVKLAFGKLSEITGLAYNTVFKLVSRELSKEVSVFDGDDLVVKNIEFNSLQQVQRPKSFQKQDITGSISLKNKLINNCAESGFA